MPSARSVNLRFSSIRLLLQLGAFSILASSALCTAAASYEVPLSPLYEFLPDAQLAPASLENFIESENLVALRGVLQNIGPDGVNADGAAPGLVVASPSKTDPNCK